MLKKFLIDPRYSFDVEELNGSANPFEQMVNICINGVTHKLSKGWLVLVAHYEVRLPIEHALKIHFTPVNSAVINNRAGYLMEFDRPLEHGDGFYIIPGFTKYVVNRRGVVKLIKNDNILAESINAFGYPIVRLYDPDKGGYREVCVHLLLARTFIKNMNHIEKPYVNHLNGDKLDYSLRNLEWCSALENNQHAIKLGLRTDNVPCLVRDVISGDIKRYCSLSEACRALGYQGKQNITTLYNGRPIPRLLKNRYEIKLEKDLSDWYHQGVWNVRPVSDNLIEVMDVKDRNITVCRSMAECTRLTGVDHSSIKARLLANDYRSIRGFVFRIKTDTPWPEHFEGLIHFKSRSVLVTEVKSGQQKTFNSINTASSYCGVDKQTLRNRLLTGKPHRGFLFQEIHT